MSSANLAHVLRLRVSFACDQCGWGHEYLARRGEVK